MNKLLELMKKEPSAWDFYIFSKEDLEFIKDLEDAFAEETEED